MMRSSVGLMQEDERNDDPIVRRLRTIGQSNPGLAEAVLVYGAVLPLLRNAEIQTVPMQFIPDQARHKLEKGFPLVHGLDIEVEFDAISGLMVRFAGAVEDSGSFPQLPDGAKIRRELFSCAGRIRSTFEKRTPGVDAIVQHICAGDKPQASDGALNLGLDPELLWLFGRHALRPLFHALHRQVEPLFEGAGWLRGYCFVCGSMANFGELRGNNQQLHMRCVQCGSDWPFRRMLCSHCGNEEHTTLGFLYEEEHRDKYRVDVCEKCRGYLKIIASYEPISPGILPVEDLATLHLDYYAETLGYRRPVGPAFAESPAGTT